VVKKANDPGKLMDVGEFLRHVRRLVVDFVVGRVLSHGADGQVQDTSGLDDPTTYYLLHRHDFGMDDAPVGPCILYAVSCGLKDADLVDQFDLLLRTGKASDDDEDEESPLDAPDEPEAGSEKGSGSKVKLKPWNQRKRPGMGFDPSTDSARARRAASQPALFEGADPVIRSREVPMIDKVHRLMHLWRAGDVVNVDEYIDSKGIRKNELFGQLLQALIELAPAGSEERSLMEAISNHLAARGVAPDSLYDRVS
jgi:putative DNA methylase